MGQRLSFHNHNHKNVADNEFSGIRGYCLKHQTKYFFHCDFCTPMYNDEERRTITDTVTVSKIGRSIIYSKLFITWSAELFDKFTIVGSKDVIKYVYECLEFADVKTEPQIEKIVSNDASLKDVLKACKYVKFNADWKHKMELVDKIKMYSECLNDYDSGFVVDEVAKSGITGANRFYLMKIDSIMKDLLCEIKIMMSLK